VVAQAKERTPLCIAGIAECNWTTGVIGLIEGILYLTKSDEEFVRLYVENQRQWF